MAGEVKAICNKLMKKATDKESKEFLNALIKLEAEVEKCKAELGLA